MSNPQWIVCNPEILCGKPTIRGTRISIELIHEMFAAGKTIETILVNYPHLKRNAIRAALAYKGPLTPPSAIEPPSDRCS